MSHAAAWRCRSEACLRVLGHVRDGVLHPLVPVGSVDGRGVARLACSQCGRVRVWLPASAGPAATDRPSTRLLDSRTTGRGTLG